jgi:hypothetical protein
VDPAPAVTRVRAHPVLVTAGLLVLLMVPLLVALVALREPRWYPILDIAETELRVRDVASADPPLIGLAGRIGPFGPDGGSHPGPLSFFAIWPVWALLGGSSFGMYAGMVVLDAAAFALCLWMAYRRGGLPLVLGVTVVLTLLTRAYGAFLLTLPWNPYLPVLWWVVFLLAAWSVLDDDLAMLPVLVIAGSMCMQTHIPYLGLVGGLTALVAGALVYGVVRRPSFPRRDLLRYGAIALVLGALLWTPPVVDQIVHDPGNLGTIRDHFSHPPEAPIGIGTGIDAFLTQLDPVKLFTHTIVRNDERVPVSGSRLPGVLLIAAWGAAVYGAWRLRVRRLLLLDLVLGVALVLGMISAARIFGEVFYYLLLWAWGIAALMLLAIGLTIAEAVRVRRADAAVIGRWAVVGGLAFCVVNTAVFARTAAYVDVQSPHINAVLAALSPPTIDALDELERAGGRGPYLVTWLPDPQAIGSAGYGLLDELDRHGFDVRADAVFRPGATRNHIIEPEDATTEVHLATGETEIERMRDRSAYREVAFVDPRSEAERAEFEQLRAEVAADLRAAGLDDRVAQVDDNLFMLGLAPGVPERTRDAIARMLALGMPAAVFIGPPGTS